MLLLSQTFISAQRLQRWRPKALTVHTVADARRVSSAALPSVSALKNNWIKWQTVCDDRERGVMGGRGVGLRGERGADKSKSCCRAAGQQTDTQGPQSVPL